MFAAELVLACSPAWHLASPVRSHPPPPRYSPPYHPPPARPASPAEALKGFTEAVQQSLDTIATAAAGAAATAATASADLAGAEVDSDEVAPAAQAPPQDALAAQLAAEVLATADAPPAAAAAADAPQAGDKGGKPKPTGASVQLPPEAEAAVDEAIWAAAAAADGGAPPPAPAPGDDAPKSGGSLKVSAGDVCGPLQGCAAPHLLPARWIVLHLSQRPAASVCPAPAAHAVRARSAPPTHPLQGLGTVAGTVALGVAAAGLASALAVDLTDVALLGGIAAAGAAAFSTPAAPTRGSRAGSVDEEEGEGLERVEAGAQGAPLPSIATKPSAPGACLGACLPLAACLPARPWALPRGLPLQELPCCCHAPRVGRATAQNPSCTSLCDAPAAPLCSPATRLPACLPMSRRRDPGGGRPGGPGRRQEAPG